MLAGSAFLPNPRKALLCLPALKKDRAITAGRMMRRNSRNLVLGRQQGGRWTTRPEREPAQSDLK